MSTFLNQKYQTINPFVYKQTFFVNTLFLLCHTFFAALYKVHKADILYCYNIISILTYIAGYFILYKQKSNFYINMIFLEIYIFTVLNVSCLGWDYGFQLYCISFLVSSLFTDFYVNPQHKIRKGTILFIIIDISTFLILRIWTYRRLPLYTFHNDLLIHVFFITNSLIMFAFIIIYSCTYSRMAYKLENALVTTANSDSLTGLNNRRNMQDMLDAIPENSFANTQQMCIAMIDIDNFKRINDTYGHNTGDKVLKSFADILIQMQHENDNFNVCRWGGEEFLIFYQNYSETAEDIYRIFEKIRLQASQKNINHENSKIHYTITIGLAFHAAGNSIDDMIKQADDNLYKGKESTKNIVIWNH